MGKEYKCPRCKGELKDHLIEIDSDYGVAYFCSQLCKYIWANENDFDEESFEALTKLAIEHNVQGSNEMIKAVLTELISLMKDKMGRAVCERMFKQLSDLKTLLSQPTYAGVLISVKQDSAESQNPLAIDEQKKEADFV